MGEAGGTPTHVAMSPTDAVAEATRTDGQGRPLYAGGVLPDLYGLSVVRVPGLEQPLVYDASTTYLVVARDFTVRSSLDYAPAFKADKTALRVTGRSASASRRWLSPCARCRSSRPDGLGRGSSGPPPKAADFSKAGRAAIA
jgi:hypothetical protein